MKTYSLFLFALVLSCNSVEKVGLDGLSNEDKEYYREQSRIKCEKDTKKQFDAFAKDSNREFQYFRRKQKWTFKTALADTTTTVYLQVWKVGPEADNYPIYFIETRPGSGADSYRFIKISKDQNTALIENLRAKLCEDEGQNTTFEFTNTNPPKVKTTTYRLGDVEDTRRKRVTEFLFESKRPAYMGALKTNVDERTVKKSSDEDAQKPDPKNYKTAETYVKEADLLYNDYRSYTNAEFCVVTSPDPFSLPYEPDCTRSASAGPDGWEVPSDDL